MEVSADEVTASIFIDFDAVARRPTDECARPGRTRRRPPGHSATAAGLSTRCAQTLSRYAGSGRLCDSALPQGAPAPVEFRVPPGSQGRWWIRVRAGGRAINRRKL